MNVVDIIILVIMLIFIVMGTYKGFIFSFVSVFSGTINFFLATLICGPFSKLFNSITGIQGAISNSYTAKFTALSSGFDANLVGLSQESITATVADTINGSSLSNFSKWLYKSVLKITPEQIAGKEFVSINSILSTSLGKFFTTIISFIICFALIYLILWIISLIGKKVQSSDGGIKTADRVFGFIFGVIKGLLCVCSIFAFLSFFSETGLLASLFNYIKTSKIGAPLYNYVNNIMDTYFNIPQIWNSIKSLFKG